jgi:hypothetical protein
MKKIIFVCSFILFLLQLELPAQENTSKKFYSGVVRDGSVQLNISFWYDSKEYEITKFIVTEYSLNPFAGISWQAVKSIDVSEKNYTFDYSDDRYTSLNGKVDSNGSIKGKMTFQVIGSLTSSFTSPRQQPLEWIASPINYEEYIAKINFTKTNINLLSKAILHANPEYRIKAIKFLMENGSDSAIVVLREALKSIFDDVRWNASLALGYLNNIDSAAQLITLLNDNNPTVQWVAAKTLGMVKAKDAILPLLKLTQNKNIYIRWYSTEALANFNDPEITNYFTLALEKKDLDVISSGRKYYISLATNEAINVLIDLLNKDNNLGLANDLIKSKNPLLIDAVKKWGAQHGYSIRE